MEKKEILFWADSPTCSTGFATVSRNIIKRLHATGKYRFTVLGISYLGTPVDTEKHPYLKYPEQGGLTAAGEGGDVYGFTRLARMLQTDHFDILFILNDTFVMEHAIPKILEIRNRLKRKFKIIFYFPIDSEPKHSWIANTVKLVDYPVTYTEYARELVRKHFTDAEPWNLQVIYHGTDKEAFYPIPGEARKTLRKGIFGPVADRFIVLNVNRNQPRKDFNSMFAAFAKFHKKFPETYLYVLAAMDDAGGNMDEIASQHGLVYGQDWNCPPKDIYGPNQGMPIEAVNQIYNCADLVISTTLGEGWGLSLTESMAVGVPVLGPRHTSVEEILGKNSERGWLIAAGGPDHTIQLPYQDNNRVRPMIHIDEMVDTMIKIMRYPSQSKKKIAAASAWVPTWDDVCHKWLEIFHEAGEAIERERTEGEKT